LALVVVSAFGRTLQQGKLPKLLHPAHTLRAVLQHTNMQHETSNTQQPPSRPNPRLTGQNHNMGTTACQQQTQHIYTSCPASKKLHNPADNIPHHQLPIVCKHISKVFLQPRQQQANQSCQLTAPSHVLAWVAHIALESTSSSCVGAGQVNLPLLVSHTAREVAVGG
jgi:hypothetical protein